jgi:solute carrier family 25 phosphate transporter 3
VSRTGADSQQSRKARLDVASLSQRSSKRSKARHLGRISLAGAISCSLTHCLVVPLDVIKTRMQTDASASGMRQAAAAIFSAAPGKGPMRGLAFFNGVGATATGYWMQGAAKFGASPARISSPCARACAHALAPPRPRARALSGGYEALKHVAFKHIRALPNGDALADRWRLPVMISAAFGAEGVASTFLCPLEVRALTAARAAAARTPSRDARTTRTRTGRV